jgi:DNA-binding NarL/FixJ family response regulator
VVREMTVLIVDDNAAVRSLIARLIASVAGDIHQCSGGAEAIEACSKYRPDVVLMDLAMPGVDGIAATRVICAAHPTVRVLIVTDHGGADLRHAAARAGAAGYVVKDNLLELRRVLTEH